MHHVVDGPDGAMSNNIGSGPNLGRLTVATQLEPGHPLRIVKFVSYGWSSERSAPALRDQADGRLASAERRGWDGLAADQEAFLKAFWDRADVELEGDAEIQQAIRFAMFHVLQAAARAEQRAIPAKGLTGPGYDGHTFWDSETFVLRALTYMSPNAVRDALAWRQSILPIARDRARVLGLAGAAFPWRTIRGQESSGYWPASTAAFHINADIAEAVRRYLAATNDREFERDIATELVVETARLWRSLGHHDDDGKFRIDGVTGPDEYTALADNNVYTNLMAAQNMVQAADLCVRHPTRADDLDVHQEEIASWRDAAATVAAPPAVDLGAMA